MKKFPLCISTYVDLWSPPKLVPEVTKESWPVRATRKAPDYEVQYLRWRWLWFGGQIDNER